MKLSAEEARVACAEVAAACPELAALDLSGLVLRALQAAGGTLKGIEVQVDQAGRQTEETILAIMQVGAMARVLGDLPEGDDRRKLLAAGDAVGRLLARKWGEKIQEELQRRMGPPS